MKTANKRKVSAVAASAALAAGALAGTPPALACAPAQNEQVAS